MSVCVVVCACTRFSLLTTRTHHLLSAAMKLYDHVAFNPLNTSCVEQWHAQIDKICASLTAMSQTQFSLTVLEFARRFNAAARGNRLEGRLRERGRQKSAPELERWPPLLFTARDTVTPAREAGDDHGDDFDFSAWRGPAGGSGVDSDSDESTYSDDYDEDEDEDNDQDNGNAGVEERDGGRDGSGAGGSDSAVGGGGARLLGSVTRGGSSGGGGDGGDGGVDGGVDQAVSQTSPQPAVRRSTRNTGKRARSPTPGETARASKRTRKNKGKQPATT